MNAIRAFNTLLISGLVFVGAVFAAFTYVAFGVSNPVLQEFEVHQLEDSVNDSEEEQLRAEVRLFNRGGSGLIVAEMRALSEHDDVLETWSKETEMGQLERRKIEFNISEPEESDNFIVEAWSADDPEESLSEPLRQTNS